MVWLQCVLCHASRKDRSAGLVGGVGVRWRRPGYGGLPVAHWNLHPDGSPSREYHPTHQTAIMEGGADISSLLIAGGDGGSHVRMREPGSSARGAGG